MDGDFQHPPEVIHELFRRLLNRADLVTGARADSLEGLSHVRYRMTQFGTLLARIRLMVRGLRVEDPLSGLFGGHTYDIRQLIAQNEQRVEMCGYKILFDILRFFPNDKRVENVHFHFHRRQKGDSKFGIRHGMYFLRSFFR